MIENQLIKVVELSPAQEAEYLRLSDAKQKASDKLNAAAFDASQAIKKKNAAKREYDRILKQWLPLAETKFPD